MIRVARGAGKRMTNQIFASDHSDQLKVLQCHEGSAFTQGVRISRHLAAQACLSFQRYERKPVRLD